MNKLYRKFYKEMYSKTGGFIPSTPLHQNIYPGDFFQIKNGEIIVLGNIFRKSIIAMEEVEMEYDSKLNAADWTFSEGVSIPFAGRVKEGDLEFHKEVFAFEEKGSYLFKGESPLGVKIKNCLWIESELIIKLTQIFCTFRELYIATECATTANWTLAISGAENGGLEIASDAEDLGLTGIFGHASSRTLASRSLEYYHRQNSRKPTFFKAKKMVIQEDKAELFAEELINERRTKGEWAKHFFASDFDTESDDFTPNSSHYFQAELLGLLKASELNPNTTLLYSKLEDANLEDIDKLFLS